MTQEWDKWGVCHPLTVLHLDGCQVVQVKTKENGHNYTAMQLGAGEAKVKNVTKPLREHQLKAGVKPRRVLKEFRVSEDAILPPGMLHSGSQKRLEDRRSHVCFVKQERRSMHSISYLDST